MSRKIKFRVWDIKNKKMEIAWSIDFAGKNYKSIEANEVHTGEYILGVDTQAILMQFTGLHDKNGKEIFEGDIVKIVRHIDNDVVIFKDGAFCIEGWTNTLVELMTDWYSNIDPELIEVIGNVHENPELLKDN